MPIDPRLMGQLLMNGGQNPYQIRLPSPPNMNMPPMAPMSGAGPLNPPGVVPGNIPPPTPAPGAQYLQQPSQMPFRPPMQTPLAPPVGLAPPRDTVGDATRFGGAFR